LLKADSDSYCQFYSSATTKNSASIQQLSAAIDNGYDIVHLFCDATPEGIITDSRGATITGTALIQKCCDSDVKLLCISIRERVYAVGGSFSMASKSFGTEIDVFVPLP
jgi:hypothetical protein